MLKVRATGLTPNGNEYKKSNCGKGAGFVVGGVLPSAAAYIKLSEKYNDIAAKYANRYIGTTGRDFFQNSGTVSEQKAAELLKFKKTASIAALAIAATAIAGTLLGNLYDKCINKERMAEADGRAKLEELA